MSEEEATTSSAMEESPAPRRNDDRMWMWIPVLVALNFLVLAVYAAIVETPTIDEFAHAPAGCAYVTQGRLEIYHKNPPLMKYLLALPMLWAGAETPDVEQVVGQLGPVRQAWFPWIYGEKFLEANRERYLYYFTLSRLVVIGMTLVGGVLLYLWARGALDHRAAALVTSLYFCSPSLLAHGHLATLDAGCMVSILLTLLCAWWLCAKPTWLRACLLGVSLGLALLVKFTAVLLLPVLLCSIVVACWRRWGQAAIHGVTVLIVATLVVNGGMGFQQTCQPLKSFELRSEFGQQLKEDAPPIMPVPLPEEYVLGFDAQKVDVEKGEAGGYLFGQWARDGYWYYHLVALGVKEPLPLLLLVIIGFGAMLFQWRQTSFASYWTVLTPILVLGLAMMFLNRLNIGIRYLLPLLPLLYMVAGFGFRHRVVRGLALAAIVYCTAMNWWTHPNHLGYFNLLAGGPSNGHRVLLDSNVDWGQDLYRVRPALAEELNYEGPVHLLYFGHVDPRVYGLNVLPFPSRPVRGVVVVSVHYVMGGVYAIHSPNGRWEVVTPDRLNWLRDYEPTVRAGSIWIYDLRQEPGLMSPPRESGILGRQVP